MPKLTDRYESKLREDFYFFVHELWREQNLHKVHKLTWSERDIIEFGAYGPKKRGILAPRAIGKSTMVSLPLPLWRLYRDPQRRCLVPSKSEGMAKKIVGTQKAWLRTTSFLQHLAPRTDQIRSDLQFEVNGAQKLIQPSVTAVGIGGQLEGNRAHTINPDDIETRQNTKTQEARQDLRERVKELGSSILYEDKDPDGPVVQDPVEICYVGTYHHEESLYIHLSELGYEIRTWPIDAPDRTMVFLGLSRKITERLEDGRLQVGDPIFPSRFDKRNIAEKYAEGRTYFNMQHRLLSNLRETTRYPLRLNDLIVHPCPVGSAPSPLKWGEHDPRGSTVIEGMESMGFDRDRLRRPAIIGDRLLPYEITIAYIDPAGYGKDRLGLSILGALGGMIYVQRCMGIAGGFDPETLGLIARTCREHRVQVVVEEDNFGGGMFGTLLWPVLQEHFIRAGQMDERHGVYQEGWSCVVETDHVTGQKELRIIESLEAPMGQHRIVIDPEAIKVDPDPDAEDKDELQYQISHITRDRKCLPEYGRIDSLAGGVRRLQESLAVRPDQAAARRRQMQLEQEQRDRDMEWAHGFGWDDPRPRPVHRVQHRTRW